MELVIQSLFPKYDDACFGTVEHCRAVSLQAVGHHAFVVNRMIALATGIVICYSPSMMTRSY